MQVHVERKCRHYLKINSNRSRHATQNTTKRLKITTNKTKKKMKKMCLKTKNHEHYLRLKTSPAALTISFAAARFDRSVQQLTAARAALREIGAWSGSGSPGGRFCVVFFWGGFHGWFQKVFFGGFHSQVFFCGVFIGFFIVVLILKVFLICFQGFS